MCWLAEGRGGYDEERAVSKTRELTLQQWIIFPLFCTFMNCIPKHIGFITFLHFTEFDIFTADFEMKFFRTPEKTHVIPKCHACRAHRSNLSRNFMADRLASFLRSSEVAHPCHRSIERLAWLMSKNDVRLRRLAASTGNSHQCVSTSISPRKTYRRQAAFFCFDWLRFPVWMVNVPSNICRNVASSRSCSTWIWSMRIESNGKGDCLFPSPSRHSREVLSLRPRRQSSMLRCPSHSSWHWFLAISSRPLDLGPYLFCVLRLCLSPTNENLEYVPLFRQWLAFSLSDPTNLTQLVCIAIE